MKSLPPLAARPLSDTERWEITDRVGELLYLQHRDEPIKGYDERAAQSVDPSARRIVQRLGLVPDAQAQASEYAPVLRQRAHPGLHTNLVRHGRTVCLEDAPRCGKCPLVSFCVQGRAIVGSEKAGAPGSRTKAATASRPIAVELFAGGGGLGEGFTRAGFEVTVAVEWDRAAAQTYRINHPGTVVLEADATLVTSEHIAFLSPRSRHPDAIIAGPPCQGYSIAGKRQAADGKNSLYQAVINLAKALQPRFVAIENVPGLRHVEGKSFVSTINDALAGVGYSSQEHLLRACDFGVPQLRRRILFLAQHQSFGEAPAAPKPTHCPGRYCELKCEEPGANCGRTPTPTVLESLKGLPALGTGVIAEYTRLSDGTYLLNGSTMNHSDKVVRKIKRIVAGAGPISYRRLHKDLARTIVAGHRALPVHPTLHRTLSVREAARIQGFSDAHVFSAVRSRQPLQVANAVPPLLAQAVAAALLKARMTALPGVRTEPPHVTADVSAGLKRSLRARPAASEERDVVSA